MKGVYIPNLWGFISWIHSVLNLFCFTHTKYWTLIFYPSKCPKRNKIRLYFLIHEVRWVHINVLLLIKEKNKPNQPGKYIKILLFQATFYPKSLTYILGLVYMKKTKYSWNFFIFQRFILFKWKILFLYFHLQQLIEFLLLKI